ncbi:MAG: VCBS repeat-containing protein [Yoonia sp.]|nr:VCBS repeat-containing protein [Yoonia sp.]MDG1862894.1 VCBS repeat-containing protein [Yoonia sp.]
MRIAAAVALWAFAGTASAEVIVAADYVSPTERYAHGVLGDKIEHAGLRVTLSSGAERTAIWSELVVFEDTMPRLVDLDGDGAPEVITVESHELSGARLAIWGLDANDRLVKLAQNDFYGTPFRWLAIAGAADLDGDGNVEIAYVDRPHLAKQLMIWRYVPGQDGNRLDLVATKDGLTNHRIGETDIGGGLRNCDGVIEVVTANDDWSRVMASRLVDGAVQTRDIGPHTGRASFDAALGCL